MFFPKCKQLLIGESIESILKEYRLPSIFELIPFVDDLVAKMRTVVASCRVVLFHLRVTSNGKIGL